MRIEDGDAGLPSRTIPRPVVPRCFRLGFTVEHHTILGSRCGVVGAVGPMVDLRVSIADDRERRGVWLLP